MPVFVSDDHFLDDLLNVLISSFDGAVHFWSVRRRVMMLNLEFLTQFFHHLVVQVRTIVSNDLAGNTISANNVILDKPHNHLSCNIGVRCCFDPFGEVINSYQDETMTV